jgi:hypothetical protein
MLALRQETDVSCKARENSHHELPHIFSIQPRIAALALRRHVHRQLQQEGQADVNMRWEQTKNEGKESIATTPSRLNHCHIGAAQLSPLLCLVTQQVWGLHVKSASKSAYSLMQLTRGWRLLCLVSPRTR